MEFVAVPAKSREMPMMCMQDKTLMTHDVHARHKTHIGTHCYTTCRMV